MPPKKSNRKKEIALIIGGFIIDKYGPAIAEQVGKLIAEGGKKVVDKVSQSIGDAIKRRSMQKKPPLKVVKGRVIEDKAASPKKRKPGKARKPTKRTKKP